MNATYNIYCDESCHMEHDHKPVMVLGAVWCPTESARRIADAVREVKTSHGLSSHFEAKWTKVSPGKADFYTDLINYFFAEDELHFRAVVIADKTQLEHEAYGQTHDEWYYKMYYTLLRILVENQERCRIYLDIKDTRGGAKVRKLEQILRSTIGDRRGEIVEWVQIVQSHDVQQIQLADLLIGAVCYAHRGLSTNAGKLAVVREMESGISRKLTGTSPRAETKVNIFHWRPTEKND